MHPFAIQLCWALPAVGILVSIIGGGIFPLILTALIAYALWRIDKFF